MSCFHGFRFYLIVHITCILLFLLGFGTSKNYLLSDEFTNIYLQSASDLNVLSLSRDANVYYLIVVYSP